MHCCLSKQLGILGIDRRAHGPTRLAKLLQFLMSQHHSRHIFRQALPFHLVLDIVVNHRLQLKVVGSAQ